MKWAKTIRDIIVSMELIIIDRSTWMQMLLSRFFSDDSQHLCTSLRILSTWTEIVLIIYVQAIFIWFSFYMCIYKVNIGNFAHTHTQAQLLSIHGHINWISIFLSFSTRRRLVFFSLSYKYNYIYLKCSSSVNNSHVFIALWSINLWSSPITLTVFFRVDWPFCVAFRSPINTNIHTQKRTMTALHINVRDIDHLIHMVMTW